MQFELETIIFGKSIIYIDMYIRISVYLVHEQTANLQTRCQTSPELRRLAGFYPYLREEGLAFSEGYCSSI